MGGELRIGTAQPVEVVNAGERSAESTQSMVDPHLEVQNLTTNDNKTMTGVSTSEQRKVELTQLFLNAFYKAKTEMNYCHY